MSTPVRPRLSRLLQAVVGLVTALALVLFWPAAASAHDTLIDSSPAAGSVVETLPETLTLTYSAELISGEGTTVVEVTGPDGAPAHIGAPVVEGAIVTVPLTRTAPAGEYAVEWRVVSSDGHPISGEFVFDVLTASEPEPAEEPSPEPTTEPAPQASDLPVVTTEPDDAGAVDGTTDDNPPLLRALPWIIGAVLLTAVAVAAVFVVVQRARRARSAASDDVPGR